VIFKTFIGFKGLNTATSEKIFCILIQFLSFTVAFLIFIYLL